jgi:hypothetical protein
MTNEQLRMQMLSGIITETEYKAKLQENKKKKSLNEHFVAGGIVGVGAINTIPPRAKADFEMAFDYFLNERYEVDEDESGFGGMDPKGHGNVKDDTSLSEDEGAFDSPSDTNPVVQGYLKQLMDILRTQTDDTFDLKNLKYAVNKFSDMVNDEIAKFEIEEGKEDVKDDTSLNEEEVKEALQNDDMIYDRMMDMDQEQLISSMLSYAEQNPSVTLTDYLNDGFGYESEDDLEEGKEVEEPSNY